CRSASSCLGFFLFLAIVHPCDGEPASPPFQATTQTRRADMSTATAATGEHVTQPAGGAHERFFAAGRTQLVDEHDRVLWQTLQRLTEGGKRFRPLLLSRTYAALGGEDQELAATIGEAVELLHTAFVIHDDVIDGDLVRRGAQCRGSLQPTSGRGGRLPGTGTQLRRRSRHPRGRPGPGWCGPRGRPLWRTACGGGPAA